MRIYRCTLVLWIAVLSAGTLWAGAQQEDPTSDNETEAVSVIEENDMEKPDWLLEETSEYITVIDAAGDKIQIAKPVKRVIASGMGELFSTLRALKADEMILASTEYVTRNSGFFPEISKLPSISTVDQVDHELIIQLNPDVIFCVPSFYSQLNDIVTETFPVVQVSFETIADIQMVGTIMGKEEATEDYVGWIEDFNTMVDERIGSLSEDEYKEVFIFYGGEYGMAPPPPYGTFGRDNPRNELIRRAGGISISEELEGAWISVDPEWVIEQNPPILVRECYITSDKPEMGYNVVGRERADGLMDFIISQPALSSTAAVENENVLMIYGDLFEDSWFLATAYLAKYFHPDLFEDLDPLELHQEFLTRFQGLDFDVETQGLFVHSLK